MHTPTLQERAPIPAVIERIDADTFLEMQYLPEFRDKEYELLHGEMIEMPSTDLVHGEFSGELYSYLKTFVRRRGLGRVTVEAGFRSEFDHRLLLRPDVAFIAYARAPKGRTRGITGLMPDLAIEVDSPGNSLVGLRDKADIYLRNGARLVWLVFPDDQRIEVHSLDDATESLGINDTLTGGSVLPGFSLPLHKLFDL